MDKIKSMRELSKHIHEVRDNHLVELVKLHNKHWKNVDVDNDLEIIEAYNKLYPLLIDEIFNCLEEVIASTLKTISKLFQIKNNVILDVEDLMYDEDGKTLNDRLYEYYIIHKGEKAVYNLTRLMTTEVEYVFSGVMQDKIDIDEYNYFMVDNLDDVEDCDGACPDVQSIFPINAEKPPYHPDCECFWIAMTNEEVEKRE